jgi:hypothetical protein
MPFDHHFAAAQAAAAFARLAIAASLVVCEAWLAATEAALAGRPVHPGRRR